MKLYDIYNSCIEHIDKVLTNVEIWKNGIGKTYGVKS
jgi:hypothetical protein